MKKFLISSAFATALAMSNAHAQTVPVPDHYPADYKSVVEGSRAEGLVIYSNMADNNWQPIIKGFNAKYPWVKIETVDLGSGTVHSRWEAEKGSSARTADVLVSGANDRWASYGKDGLMVDYKSPEIANLPEFAHPYPGVNVLSTDPLVITYNAALLPEDQRPKGFASLVEDAVADPDTFDGKITTYDAARNRFGLTAWWAYLDRKGDAGWTGLAQDRSDDPRRNLRRSDERKDRHRRISDRHRRFRHHHLPAPGAAGRRNPRLCLSRRRHDHDAAWHGHSEGAANPNSAKLFVDYALSQDGQTQVGKGGLVPYREDVTEDQVRYTFQEIAKSSARTM